MAQEGKKLNLRSFEPSEYIRLVVTVVFEDEEKREVIAREEGALRRATGFLKEGIDKGAIMGEVSWVLEDDGDYVVEKRVVMFF